MRKVIFAVGCAASAAFVAAALAYDVSPLPGYDGTVIAATALRTEPGPGAGELVVTLQPGERVALWAFTYITERARTPAGPGGGFTVTEEYKVWYRVRTAAGAEGWLAAAAVTYPSVPPD